MLTVAITVGLAAQSRAQTSDFALSQEEQEWISANPVVRVGGEIDWFPYDFVDDKGQFKGVANDFLQIIAARTGLQFEVETGTSKYLIDKMSAGHIDLLAALYHSDERAQRFNYTSPYFQVTDYIFARDDTGVTSEEDLPGKTVAIVKGSVSVDRFRQAHPEVRILELETIQASIHAVATYKADLLFERRLMLRKHSCKNPLPIFGQSLLYRIQNPTVGSWRPGRVYRC